MTIKQEIKALYPVVHNILLSMPEAKRDVLNTTLQVKIIQELQKIEAKLP